MDNTVGLFSVASAKPRFVCPKGNTKRTWQLLFWQEFSTRTSERMRSRRVIKQHFGKCQWRKINDSRIYCKTIHLGSGSRLFRRRFSIQNGAWLYRNNWKERNVEWWHRCCGRRRPDYGFQIFPINEIVHRHYYKSRSWRRYHQNQRSRRYWLFHL